MPDDIILPTRNVLDVVSHGDQRQIRWFETITGTVNALASGVSAGTGGILDMGDRITGSSLYDGGARV
jgi:hypothetical protein